MRSFFLITNRTLAGLLLCVAAGIGAGIPDPLPGTSAAGEQPDWRERQRLQIVHFLKASTADARRTRDRVWAGSEDSAHRASLQAKLGIDPNSHQSSVVWHKLSDGAVAVEEVVSTRSDGLRVRALVFSTRDQGSKRQALIAVPDSNQTAERFSGISEGGNPPQWLTRLLRSGNLVAVPTMVERTIDHPLCVQLKGKDRRHILHRFGFVVGRTVTGIDVEKVLLLRRELALRNDVDASRISIAGVGQGGMTALYAAAVEPAFSAAGVLDYFSQREEAWKEPVDRMIFGQLLEFGDAEVAALIAPRKLILVTSAAAEVERATEYFRRRRALDSLVVIRNSSAGLQEVVSGLYGESAGGSDLEWRSRISNHEIQAARNADFESEANYLRRLIGQSEAKREAYWKGQQRPVELLAQHEGVPAAMPVPLRPRTRLIRVTDKWTAYEVFAEVGGGMEVYGHLLVPRGATGKLPAVICQHGLDGQPKDITGIGNEPAPVYHSFGKALADRGYVVFAPYLTVPVPQAQLINELVRRAAPLGMMRTGIEVLKLRRVVDFLQAQPFVDSKRIGYYGLSYGGYSTLWMGPLEPRLAAIVISGHFNDWTAKITNEELSTSYMKHPDEDFYSWNALRRFTHPELIAAMAPRPVMVEFAENDPTTTPAWHDRAWAQVKAADTSGRVERERFVGVHEIGGMRTFEFLDRQLRPEKSSSREYTYLLWPNDKKLPGIADRSEDTLPYIVYKLDASPEARLRDTFTVAGQFRGVDLRLSRVGNPGDVIVRFGSAEGGEDLGKARIRAADVTPLYDLWHAARVSAVKLAPAREYHLEITVESGGSPADHYLVYGPKPLGGQPEREHFTFAYRPLQPAGAKASDEPTHEFIREYLRPKLPELRTRPDVMASSDDLVLDSGWKVRTPANSSDVVVTAADELKRFLSVLPKSSAVGNKIIDLRIDDRVTGVDSNEGFRIDTDEGVTIRAISPRGIMRGIYWLQDAMLTREAPYLKRGVTTRNARLARRITTSVTPGGDRYTETSRPLLYTDGLLQRISRDGFNGIWIWMNTEEAAMNSRVFPELDDPNAASRLQRLADTARRAKRFGIDVYVYLATGYNHHVPASFYEKHPEAKGYGWGSPMETTVASVRQYQAEIVTNIFRRAPDLKGMVLIFDSEGFYYSGNSESSRQKCPTCRNMTQEEIALQLLTNLNDAMRRTGGTDKELIAFSYGRDVPWVERLIPMLPKSIILQNDFSKGGTVIRDGVTHVTGDYNLTLIGPPETYVHQREAARRAGLQFITKTEHAVSQEFVFAPYIPAMEQWAERIEKIRSFDTQGVFANWCHYGYLASPPAQLLNEMSFDPALPIEEELRAVAVRNYGGKASPLVMRAWHYFSEGIRQFPYSDNVSRLPGPLQKGPSNPFFLDPTVPSFGAWRSWQNDLGWTKPWGPAIAAKYLSKVRDDFRKGATLLAQARSVAGESHREAVSSEWRIATLLESSLQTMLHLIDWIQTRDRFYQASASADKEKLARALADILVAERSNVQRILPLLEQDSRLGYASEGGGIVRGGLFTPELVRWKLGQIDNTLRIELPRLAGIAPVPVPNTIAEKIVLSKAN